MRSLWTNIDKCEGRRTGRNRYNSDGEIDNYQVKNRYSYIDYKANVVSYCTLRPYEQWEEWRPSNSVGVKNQLSITYSERFFLWYTVVVLHKKTSTTDKLIDAMGGNLVRPGRSRYSKFEKKERRGRRAHGYGIVITNYWLGDGWGWVSGRGSVGESRGDNAKSRMRRAELELGGPGAVPRSRWVGAL